MFWWPQWPLAECLFSSAKLFFLRGSHRIAGSARAVGDAPASSRPRKGKAFDPNRQNPAPHTVFTVTPMNRGRGRGREVGRGGKGGICRYHSLQAHPPLSATFHPCPLPLRVTLQAGICWGDSSAGAGREHRGETFAVLGDDRCFSFWAAIIMIMMSLAPPTIRCTARPVRVGGWVWVEVGGWLGGLAGVCWGEDSREGPAAAATGRVKSTEDRYSGGVELSILTGVFESFDSP